MIDVLKNTASITVLVISMMIIIEVLNYFTQGIWFKGLKQKSFLQVVLASLLGALPGCLGSFSLVSLYNHGIVGLGALVACFVATSGDEAFYLLAVSPDTAIRIFGILFVVAIFAGSIVNILEKKSILKFKIKRKCATCYSDINKEQLNLKKGVTSFSKLKVLLLILSIASISLILSGFLSHVHSDFGFKIQGHTHTHVHTTDCNHTTDSTTAEHVHDSNCNHNHTEKIIKNEHNKDCNHSSHTCGHGHDHSKMGMFEIVMLVLMLIVFLIVLFSTSEFIYKYIWKHIVKSHFIRIFLWSFVALSLVWVLNYFGEFKLVEEYLNSTNIYWILLIIAILVGIIPESGPHMIFVSLYLVGVVPFGILIANSIVQDGHGSLPLFAESKKSFLYSKLINMILGLLVGALFFFI